MASILRNECLARPLRAANITCQDALYSTIIPRGLLPASSLPPLFSLCPVSSSHRSLFLPIPSPSLSLQYLSFLFFPSSPFSSSGFFYFLISFISSPFLLFLPYFFLLFYLPPFTLSFLTAFPPSPIPFLLSAASFLLSCHPPSASFLPFPTPSSPPFLLPFYSPTKGGGGGGGRVGEGVE